MTDHMIHITHELGSHASHLIRSEFNVEPFSLVRNLLYVRPVRETQIPKSYNFIVINH